MSTILLLGHGIGYSASPAMQAAGLAALGLAHRYELADLPADLLAGAVEGLRAPTVLGANVTTPHKRAAAVLVDELSADAAEAAAVNTIVRDGDRLRGLNTDLPALVEEVAALRPTARHAVVLGSGGASRALIVALRRTGTRRVTVVSRSSPPGGASDEAGADETVGWDALGSLLPQADLLVNATPVGTGSDATPVPPRLLHPRLAVLDLVYRPSPTRLVEDARAVGAPARSGAGLLLGQGWRSLAAWTGAAPPVEAMRAALRVELGARADV